MTAYPKATPTPTQGTPTPTTESTPSVHTDLFDDLAQSGVAALYWHGSRAHGAPGPGSDYDVAVLFDARVPSDWPELFSRLEPKLASYFQTDPDLIDLQVLNFAPPAFQYRAIKPGKILWEADSHARVHFEARLLSEYLDDLYYEDIHNRAMLDRIQGGQFGRRSASGHPAAG